MRSSPRRSGQVASERSKVSEHPLIGPSPGPPGPPVIQGLSTVEVRWILPGQLDAAVAGWFGRFPGAMDSREDAYLVHPVLRGLAVKIRAGQLLEVKQYHGSLGILDAAGRARGRIECWQKWSFPIGPLGRDDAGAPSWTVVHKRRRMSRFRLAGGRLIAEAAERATGPECGVELTEVRSGGQTWWSLGFEVTGPADLLRRTLEGTAALMFAQAPPGGVELDMGHCQSYAEWLSRHRVTAAIHPRKGEESPGPRRQDQSSSHDQRPEGRTEMTRGRGTPWLTWSPSDIQT
jgi:hypothetical protein